MTIDERTSASEADELRGRMVERLMSAQSMDQPVANAFRTVPRHLFLPGIAVDRVYSGAVVPTRFNESGQAISSSSEVAVMVPMLQRLALRQGQRVLEIGAGTGYNAALLSELVGAQGRVTTIDIDETITSDARAHLKDAGYERVSVETGDGWQGWHEGAPYDRIMVTASAADLSPRWSEQLVDGGLLCVPFVFRPNAFTIPVFRKEGERFRSVAIVQGGFMPLRGAGAPPDATRRLGDWRYTSARPLDEAKLEALLKEPVSVELDGDWNWKAMALLAFAEPDAITLSRVDRPMASIGIFDGEGLAVAEGAGGTVAGWRTLFANVGAPSTLARLRERLGELAERGWDDVRIEAVPTGADRPAGTNVFERANYTYGVGLP
jgi:methyltransferase of FxLD system